MTLKGWPNSPKAIKSSWWMVLWDGIFDLLLFACAVAFLFFAVAVSRYDQVATAENPKTTELLLNATKYVSNTEFAATHALT